MLIHFKNSLCSKNPHSIQKSSSSKNLNNLEWSPHNSLQSEAFFWLEAAAEASQQHQQQQQQQQHQSHQNDAEGLIEELFCQSRSMRRSVKKYFESYFPTCRSINECNIRGLWLHCRSHQLSKTIRFRMASWNARMNSLRSSKRASLSWKLVGSHSSATEQDFPFLLKKWLLDELISDMIFNTVVAKHLLQAFFISLKRSRLTGLRRGYFTFRQLLFSLMFLLLLPLSSS